MIDRVNILNQYAIFSTYLDDPLFNNNNKKEILPIFCAGIINALGHKVYNFKKYDFIFYISQKQNLNIELSSNLIIKSYDSNKKLIAIIPYASFAMKILRQIDPKITQNIIIIGKNFFYNLSVNILKISGANVILLENFDELRYYKEETIDYLIIGSEMSQNKNRAIYESPNIKKYLFLNQISTFDVGLEDPKYHNDIKYPFSYVRWDYQNNLKFFIDFVKKKKINLDFINLFEVDINSIEEIKKEIEKIEKETLFLFKLI